MIQWPGNREDAGRSLPLLGAFCLFLSGIEYLIPKPLPFMRIGLANLPLMLALDLFPLKTYLLLALIKVLGQAIVTGTLFSYVFLFSFAGSFVSALSMFALRRFPGPGRLSLAGIGAAGAVLSNGTQLVLARFLVFGAGIRFLIPPFLAAGLVTGFSLGLFCERFRSRSRWYSSRQAAYRANRRQTRASPGSVLPVLPELSPEASASPRRRRFAEFLEGKGLVLAGLLMGTAFLLNPSLPFRALQFLFFWLCALASGRRQRPLLTLSVIAAVVLVNLLAPYGRVLAEFGPLKITGGSLAAGLLKGISLEGLLTLSGALISCGALDSLPRRCGRSAAGTGGPENSGLGAILGESFRLFGKIGEKKGRIKVNRVIEGIDALLLELEREGDAGESGAGGAETSRRSRGRLLIFLGTPLTVALTLIGLFRN